MIDVSVTVAIVAALFIGYGTGRYRRSKNHHRCPSTLVCLTNWERQEYDRTTVRCNQDAGHTGPHGAWWRMVYRWWWGTSEPDDVDNEGPA